MITIVKRIINGYNHLMDDLSDPRLKDWPLMSSPFPTIFLSLCYLIFVTKIGPSWMKNRKPFRINNILIAYNAFQTILSSWLFYQACAYGWLNSYNFICQPADYSLSPQQRKMVAASYWFYFSKFTEFPDTIFFILRKRFDLVTVLHVVHHAIVPVLTWLGAKFVPAGHYTFPGLLNTFVHIIMYSYYMFAAMGPKYRKFLWWKKYLTTLQLIQFALVILHTGVTLVVECDVPKAFCAVIGFQAVLFYCLFYNFYRQEYIKKQKMQEARKMSNGFSKLNGTDLGSNGNISVDSDNFRKRRKDA